MWSLLFTEAVRGVQGKVLIEDLLNDNNTFEVVIDFDYDTVRDLKEKIKTQKPSVDVNQMKLTFLGTELRDRETLERYDICEGSLISWFQGKYGTVWVELPKGEKLSFKYKFAEKKVKDLRRDVEEALEEFENKLVLY